jgi:hypothetical protein
MVYPGIPPSKSTCTLHHKFFGCFPSFVFPCDNIPAFACYISHSISPVSCLHYHASCSELCYQNPSPESRTISTQLDLFLATSHLFWYTQRPLPCFWLASCTEALNSPIIQIPLRPLGKPWVMLFAHGEAEDTMARRRRVFGRVAVVARFFALLLPQWHANIPIWNN